MSIGHLNSESEFSLETNYQKFLLCFICQITGKKTEACEKSAESSEPDLGQ